MARSWTRSIIVRPSSVRFVLSLALCAFLGSMLLLYSQQPRQRPTSAMPVSGRLLVRAKLSGVVVLGMHRSGTSLLTGLLGRSGFWTADNAKELLGSNGDMFDNRKGFYERLDLLHQDDYFLRHQGVDWARYVFRFDPQVTIDALKDRKATFTDWHGNIQPLWAEGRSLMEKLGQPRDKPYVLKDPRMCLTAPVWFHLFGEVRKPAIVIAKRSPLAVARSLNKREGFGVRRGLLLWIQYNRLAIQNSRGFCIVVVDNRRLLSNAVGELQRMLREFRACGVDIHPDQVDVAEVNEWVDPNMQHDQQGDGCAGVSADRGRNFALTWKDVRNPANAAEPQSIETDYNAAMTLYCDMGNGRAFQENYDWGALLNRVENIENVT